MSSLAPVTSQAGPPQRTIIKRPGKRQYIMAGCGLLAGLLAWELVLTPFVASWYYPKTPVRTVGIYGEGTAISHFVPDGIGTYGRRLTANPPIAGAPSIAIVGDSHVVQDNVPDGETVGAALENIARAEGRPVNAHQYGWYETAAPTYIASAADILARTNASKAVVLMNFNDFSNAVTSARYWRMERAPDGSYAFRDVRPPQATGPAAEFREMLTGSRLLLSVFRRGTRIFEVMTSRWRQKPAPRAQLSAEEVARVSVSGLRKAYGERLFILYTPVCGVRCGPDPEPAEAALLETCRREGTHCVSMRKDMIEDAARNNRFSRGFHNTAPGVGHLNRTGLELAARVIWREIGASVPQTR